MEGDRRRGECLINKSWKVAERSGDGRGVGRREREGVREAECVEEGGYDGRNPFHPEDGERRVVKR